LTGREHVFELVRLAGSDANKARLRLYFRVARAVVAALRIETIEVHDLAAGLAECSGIPAQQSKGFVAGDESQVAFEDREAEVQRVEPGTQDRCASIRRTGAFGLRARLVDRARLCIHRKLVSRNAGTECA